uniref:Lamin A n=1 Tax=Eptatretus burgeri TaxID=7764 RepID=A0A8C4QAM2_EPTBU
PSLPHCTPPILTAPLPPSLPVRISREEEKDELQKLNDRLAAYIERVHFLESDNASLRVRVKDYERDTNRRTASLQDKFEETLKSQQTALGSARRERDKETLSILERIELWVSFALFVAFYFLFILISCTAIIRLLLAICLFPQLAGRLAEANSKLAEEILLRVDVENRLQSLKEELEFRKNVHEEVIDNPSWVEDGFQQRLLLALQDLREQHAVQLQAYQQEIELTQQAKSADLCSRFAVFAVQVDAAGSRVHELEAMLESERKAVKERLAQYEQKVEDLQATIQEQLQDYQDLLDMKLSLDMEIFDYHIMDRRLHLSPKSALRKREAPSHPVRGSRKRKRVAFLEPIDASQNVSVQATARGRIGIEDVDIDGMFVCLVNNTQEDQCMEDWTLKRQIGHQAKIEYTFPSDYVLSAGKTVTVWAASGGVSHNPPTDLLWKNQSSWGTGDDIRTFLLDSTGKVSSHVLMHSLVDCHVCLTWILMSFNLIRKSL